MINIFCVNTGTTQSFPEGMTLMEMLPSFNIQGKYPIIAAKVNNVTQGLKYRAFNSRRVEFMDYTTYIGRSVYCNSLCFLLCKAARDVFPGCRVVMRRPISKGYFCSVQKADQTVLSYSDMDKITSRMKELVEADLPFRRHEVPTEDAIKLFGEMGYEDKVKLLHTTGDVYVNYYTLDGTPDHYYEALLPSTGYMKVWELSMYKGGLLLRVPNRHEP
jgi:uridine kinase